MVGRSLDSAASRMAARCVDRFARDDTVVASKTNAPLVALGEIREHMAHSPVKRNDDHHQGDRPIMTTTIDTTTPTSTEPGYAGQTFLAGDEISIRRIEKADARFSMSWRASTFPISPAVTEEWITSDLSKGRESWYAIVRKADDRVVGSCVFHPHRVNTEVKVTIDPLFGEAAARWKAETIRLVLPWRVDETQAMSVSVTLDGDEVEAIAAAIDLGAREAARTPGLIRSPRTGEWVDQVCLVYLNRTWQDRLPVPTLGNLVRSGTGEPRPVPAKGIWEGAPSRGAILVGQRVYLKAVDTDDASEMARLGRIDPGAYPGGFRAVNNAENMAHRRLEDNTQRLRRDIGFAVRLRGDDRLIGEVAVLGVDYVNQTGETASWMFDPDFRGSGYGSEAKHLLLEYCFDILGLHAVQSRVSTENARSAAALRKQGYREAGVIPWVELDHGFLSGDIIFHLSAEEWRALPRAKAPERETA